MKYVSRVPDGGFDLVRYEDYLDRERESLAGVVRGAELLTIDRFVPSGPGSLHDARFVHLSVGKGSPRQADGESQIVRVELRLKGPYFDRHFELHYEDVASCSFEAPGPEDDLLMHELRSEEGLLIHELLFDKAKTIAVACRALRFVETLDTEGA